jgi:hypothetical protein
MSKKKKKKSCNYMKELNTRYVHLGQKIKAIKKIIIIKNRGGEWKTVVLSINGPNSILKLNTHHPSRFLTDPNKEFRLLHIKIRDNFARGSEFHLVFSLCGLFVCFFFPDCFWRLF